MKIDIITLFPEMFAGPFDHSIVKRAKDKKLVQIRLHNLRTWTKDKHQTVDDRPYGGGPGMILMVEPLYRAITTLKKNGSKVILLTPSGKTFNQKKARQLARLKHLILIAGHYEGYDERITHFIHEEISIGDYILTGGELPAIVLTDCLVRLLPNVLEKPQAILSESFSPKLKIQKLKIKKLLEYPQYTRPENFKGLKVPPVLLSGNHQKIAIWRKTQALKRTKSRRPDLLTP